MALSGCSPTWSDIYDPGVNPVHMRTRWIKDRFDRSGHFAYYEPYGRGSAEKEEFLDSINSENEFWTNEVPDPIAAQMGNVLYPRNAPVKIKKRVHFDELGTEGVDGEFEIDGGDRTDRVSWTTSTMLVAYVEKAVYSEDKERFFDYGGFGRKFVKDKEMAAKIFERMKGIDRKLKEDPTYKIGLSDHSVKRYPERHFNGALEKLRRYMEKGSGLNHDAEEFVPSGPINPTALARTSPKKVFGVYLVDDKPEKPTGSPGKQRPRGTDGGSAEKLIWSMKSESDKKIDELNHKMDLLIQMGGPIVTAEKI